MVPGVCKNILILKKKNLYLRNNNLLNIRRKIDRVYYEEKIILKNIFEVVPSVKQFGQYFKIIAVEKNYQYNKHILVVRWSFLGRGDSPSPPQKISMFRIASK